MTYSHSEKIALYTKLEDDLFNKASDQNIKELLDKLQVKDLVPVIFDLIADRRVGLLEYLYDKGVPFSYTSPRGGKALHVASAISGSLEAVKFLVERNIFTDINAKTDENETPFLLAVMYEHEDIVEYFLQHFKPDLSISTIYGDTAFTLAKKSGNKKILAMLDKYDSPKS